MPPAGNRLLTEADRQADPRRRPSTPSEPDLFIGGQTMEWWNELSTTQQVLWAIGTFSSVLLILQLGLSFFGLEHHALNLTHDAPDGHAETADSNPPGAQASDHLPLLQSFTVRNATAFLTG